MEWGKQFCGIRMSSNYQTLDLLSRVLDAYKVERIIEIGTYTGSLSIYLGLEGIRLDVPVHTIDIQKQFSLETHNVLYKLEVMYHEFDVFRDREELFKLFNGKCFVLCDGGLKSAEFPMVVQKLESGSIVAVHDYSKEFLDEHWEKWTHLAEPILKDEWMKENVQLALFKIK